MISNTPRAIVVRYVYSACIVTSTPDLRVLHDPWFTQGAYDGSWFHFPVVTNPISATGDCDFIYISHVHPDHYDPKFIREYFKAYGTKEILIANHSPNYLANKLRADGLQFTVLDTKRQVGDTAITIVPHKTGSSSDIDSAILIEYFDGVRVHKVLNLNDIIFDDHVATDLQPLADKPDILLCGFTGAGPYPQTYYELNDPNLPIEAESKRSAFFERYRKCVDHFNARVNIPFAGQYVLGGKLTVLNPMRGVADATEVLAFDRNAVVLADEIGSIDTLHFDATSVRTARYSSQALQLREIEIRSFLMDYERLMSASEIHQLPLRRLLAAAVARAQARSECNSDYHFVISLPNGEAALINTNRTAKPALRFITSLSDLPEPRSVLTIDPRYLFGLLSGLYHWNNNEVGSHTSVRRTPTNAFSREAQSFLNFLSVV